VHELSIARSIVEIASAVAREAKAERVIAVRVRVGVLSAVAPQALSFSYDVVVRDTRLEGSQLIVELVPAIVGCSACGRDSELADLTRIACAECGASTVEIRAGRELDVESIEVA
jgi:hydrogenase nickel incorporation protein HypA/HybF